MFFDLDFLKKGYLISLVILGLISLTYLMDEVLNIFVEYELPIIFIIIHNILSLIFAVIWCIYVVKFKKYCDSINEDNIAKIRTRFIITSVLAFSLLFSAIFLDIIY